VVKEYCLKVKQLGWVRGSYIGPGTHIVDRLLSRDPDVVNPISITDKVSQAHDIRYALGQSKEDIRDADRKMIEAIDRHGDKEYWINKKIASIPIKTKMKAEDWGLDTSGIATFGGDKYLKYKDLLESKLKELEQQGFGRR
jgi:hypothetical protein